VNFEGEASRVGDLIIPVSELDIFVATGIPAEGEKWFKGNYLNVDECKQLFAKGYEDTKLFVGAPRACISEEDDEILKVIQQLFTCEGRFNMVYAYHMRLLMHFRGVKPLNILFFLHRSLRKMADKVKKHSGNSSSHLFHCGLIHLLIVKELAKRKKTWGSFLEKLGYVQIPPVPLKVKVASPSGKRRSSKMTKMPRRDDEEEASREADAPEEVPAQIKRVRRLDGVAKTHSLKADNNTRVEIGDEIPNNFQAKLIITEPRDSASLEQDKKQIRSPESPVKGDGNASAKNEESSIDAAK